MGSGGRLRSPATAVASAGAPCPRSPADACPCRSWQPHPSTLPLPVLEGSPPSREVSTGVARSPWGPPRTRQSLARGSPRPPLFPGRTTLPDFLAVTASSGPRLLDPAAVQTILVSCVTD